MSDQCIRLLVQCPDRSGIVAAVSGFLQQHKANITALDQFSTDSVGGKLFMRIVCQIDSNLVQDELAFKSFQQNFQQNVADHFKMTWSMTFSELKKNIYILVSKHDHALMELLWEWNRGELHANICGVISNHEDLKKEVLQFGVPFYHIPVSANTRSESEKEVLKICKNNCDLIVLARYMQILSPDFVNHFPNKIINIHHSFLPAFVGADPYRQAFERGVKVIGATAHYVTDELDMGPIISQDVEHVTHRETVLSLRSTGREIERRVLAQAVKWHIEDRVFVHENKTLIF
ncbi:MAG: formyltetrahydrofolate deformylase [Pseudomonadota bacterium]